MAKDSIWQASREPQPVPAERQVGCLAGCAGHVASQAHHLEAAVKHERMNVQVVSASGIGQADFSQGLTRTRPGVPQCAEKRTQIDPGACLGLVIRRHIGRRKTRLQLFEIDPIDAFGQRGDRRHSALHVQRPLLVTALAVDLDFARRRLLGSVENDLHLAAFVA